MFIQAAQLSQRRGPKPQLSIEVSTVLHHLLRVGGGCSSSSSLLLRLLLSDFLQVQEISFIAFLMEEQPHRSDGENSGDNVAAIWVSDKGCEERCRGGLHETKVKMVLVKAVSDLSAGVRGWRGVGEEVHVRAVTRAKLIAARKRPTPGSCMKNIGHSGND